MAVFGSKVAAGAQAGIRGMEGRNRIAGAQLSKFERKALQEATDAAYIYNISPIFRWERFFPGLGNLILPPRKEGQKVSDPLVLAKRLVRKFDSGDGRQGHMIEEPLEIAEDFLRCSKEFPSRDENNLLNYGCFMTVGNPLEKLPKAEQEGILEAADLKHRNKLREKLFEADGWASDSVTRRWITPMYRQAAIFLGETEGRQWVTSRGAVADKDKTKECKFCGWDMKKSAVLCPNCKNVVDQAGYDALQKAKPPSAG